MFVDESKRTRYVVAAVEVAAADVAVVRRVTAAMRASGTRRVHFQSESNTARTRFLAEIAQLHSAGLLTVQVFECEARRELDARLAILERLVRGLVEAGGARLVLERDDSLKIHDERTIRAARGPEAGSVRYEHLRALDEPLLWIPDAIAWSWCRDRTWRERVAPVVTDVVKVPDP